MSHLEERGIELPPSDPSDDEEDDDEEEEEEQEEDPSSDEEDDDEEEEEEQDGDNFDDDDVNGRGSGTTSRQVLHDTHENDINLWQEVVNVDGVTSENDDDVTMEVEGERSSQRMDINYSKGGVTAFLKHDDNEGKGEFNRGEIDGLFCPICFEAWSSGGDHHLCCLPCGHLYGLSCIKKWLRRPGSSKCPQCKKECRIKDIRLLYATRIVAKDERLQAKCESLEKKNAEWSKKEIEWKKREADLHTQLQFLKEFEDSDDILDQYHQGDVADDIEPGVGVEVRHCRRRTPSQRDASSQHADARQSSRSEARSQHTIDELFAKFAKLCALQLYAKLCAFQQVAQRRFHAQDLRIEEMREMLRQLTQRGEELHEMLWQLTQRGGVSAAPPPRSPY